MITTDGSFKFEDCCLLIQTVQQFDHNNKVKILSSNNDKFTALTLSCLTEYSTKNVSGYEKQNI